jgi:hypothetical protein
LPGKQFGKGRLKRARQIRGQHVGSANRHNNVFWGEPVCGCALHAASYSAQSLHLLDIGELSRSPSELNPHSFDNRAHVNLSTEF